MRRRSCPVHRDSRPACWRVPEPAWCGGWPSWSRCCFPAGARSRSPPGATSPTGVCRWHLLLVIGIQKIGAPVTDTIIGSIPVVVAVVSNWHAPALPWRRLVLPVALSLSGLALINAVEFTGTHPSVAAPLGGRLLGLAAAVAAVALWTWYALANARFLRARPAIPAGSWSSVVGLATLVVTLATLLPVTLLGHTSWPAASRRDAAMFLAGIALLGVAVSWGGTRLWNTASARLPTTTAGLLINVETVSGYGYVYLVRHQWPPLGQLLGFALILAGVSLALTRRQMPKPTRQHRPPDRKPEPPDGLIPVPGRDPAAEPYSPRPARAPRELAAACFATQAPGIATKGKRE